MSFVPDVESPEQQDLRQVVRRLLEKRSSEEDVRRAMESADGYDPGLWSDFADQVGLQGLTIPEAFSGAGAGARELCVVQEELGRALTPSPYWTTVALATQLLIELADASALEDYLPAIAAGGLLATVAVTQMPGWWAPERSRVVARPDGDGWTLDGIAPNVVEGAKAGLVLVPAETGSGPSIFAVDPGTAGVVVTPLECLDLTRRQAEVAFGAVPARLVGKEGHAAAALERMFTVASLALVAEQAGGAEHQLMLAVDYAKTRYQFGRAIGSFQAIKHKLADRTFDLERIKAALDGAIEAVETDSPDQSQIVHLAKSFCSEAYFRIAADTIQILGGIGFTWEHSAHMYFRRAKSTELLLGRPHEHRERMLELLLDPEGAGAPVLASPSS